jgi:hypothetical protein
MHTRTLTIVSRNQDFTVQVCLHREDEKQDDKYMCLCSGFENVLLRMAERPRFDVQSKAECVQHEQHQPNVISGVWSMPTSTSFRSKSIGSHLNPDPSRFSTLQ